MGEPTPCMAAGVDHIVGYSGNDRLYGGAGNDRLDGGAFVDYLYGEAGDDILEGGSGNDNIYGGTGGDNLYGQAGNDIYYFSVGSSTDTIHDEAGDIMILRFSDAVYLSADFTDTDNFNRVGNNLEITIDKDSTDGITDKVTILQRLRHRWLNRNG